MNAELYHGNNKQRNKNDKKSFNTSNDSIYFTNHQKRQFVDFFKKYPCIIYVKSYFKCEFKKFALEQKQKYQCLNIELQ